MCLVGLEALKMTLKFADGTSSLQHKYPLHFDLMASSSAELITCQWTVLPEFSALIIWEYMTPRQNQQIISSL